MFLSGSWDFAFDDEAVAVRVEVWIVPRSSPE